MSSTNLKNHPKTQNQPKIKNLTLGNFKVKTHIVNSPYQIEQFDIYIDIF
jgi:hypothetical protein